MDGARAAARATAPATPRSTPTGPYATADERRVLFGLQNDREWAAFAADVLRPA